MYAASCPIEDISALLGHRSATVTRAYLGITAAHLQRQALDYDLFASEKAGQPSLAAASPGLSDGDIQRLAIALAALLQTKPVE